MSARIQQGKSGHVQAKTFGTLAPGREETLGLDLRTERQSLETLGLIPCKANSKIELNLPIMTRLVLNRLVREYGVDHGNSGWRVAQWLTTGQSGPHRHDQ